jgi:hypothetical protein
MDKNQRTTGIYALIDPRTDRVMYVGQSVDIDYRFRQHLHAWRNDSNRKKIRWIGELQKLGMVPLLRILEERPFQGCDEAETRWIRHFKVLGQCEFNRAPGGSIRRPSKLLNGHPDDWFQVGLKVKRVQALLSELRVETYALAGKRGDESIRKVIRTLLQARMALEGVLRGAFPEWTELTKVFFGAQPPDEPDRVTANLPLPTPGTPQYGPGSYPAPILGQPVPRGPLALAWEPPQP